MKKDPHHAGAVRTVERYLAANGLIVPGRPATAPSIESILIEEYADSLREVCGLVAATISHRRYTARCFLQHLDKEGITLKKIQAAQIESYITKAGKRLSRATLQHEIGALRGFLRFLALDGRVPEGLARQIDTPRLYRLEQLPRSLPWETVRALLRSIDRTSAMGLRDYAMFLLVATYGLRASEVVAITLDDIRWRQGRLRIHQDKTSSPLELPLTNEVSSALVKHLKRTPPPSHLSRDLSENARPHQRVETHGRPASISPPWFGEAVSAFPSKARIACVTRWRSVFSRMVPLLRPSATSSGIVARRVHRRICGWRQRICAKSLFQFRARVGNKEGQR